MFNPCTSNKATLDYFSEPGCKLKQLLIAFSFALIKTKKADENIDGCERLCLKN